MQCMTDANPDRRDHATAAAALVAQASRNFALNHARRTRFRGVCPETLDREREARDTDNRAPIPQDSDCVHCEACRSCLFLPCISAQLIVNMTCVRGQHATRLPLPAHNDEASNTRRSDDPQIVHQVFLVAFVAHHRRCLHLQAALPADLRIEDLGGTSSVTSREDSEACEYRSVRVVQKVLHRVRGLREWLREYLGKRRSRRVVMQRVRLQLPERAV